MLRGLESLQLVAFAPVLPSESPREMWMRVSGGNEPEQTQTTPLASAASGAWKGRRLIIQVQQGRVDVVIAPLPLGNDELPIPQALAEVEPIIIDGLRIVKSCAKGLVLDRAAIVANLIEEHETLDGAIEGVAAAVPGVPVPAGAKDLSYHTSSWLPLKAVQGLDIGRLCRWAAIARVFVQIGPTGMNVPPPDDRDYFVARSFDVSTQPSLLRIPATKQSAVFNELAAEVRALISDGYAHLG